MLQSKKLHPFCHWSPTRYYCDQDLCEILNLKFYLRSNFKSNQKDLMIIYEKNFEDCIVKNWEINYFFIIIKNSLLSIDSFMWYIDL